ncbi:MAG: lysophospholipid acyltransferase family protein [Alphaproteobacteria bacterium]
MAFFKKLLKKNIVINIVSFILFLLVRLVQLLSWTTYINRKSLVTYLKSGKPVIIVFWHSRSMLVTKVWPKKFPVYGIFSTHSDGRMIGKIYNWLGIKNILSSSKSTVSAKEVVFKFLRLLKSGISAGLTPDGPLGPAQTFTTDSVFLFAKSSGAPIVPLYASANRVKFFNSWDRFMLVKPFSKSVVEVGDFVYVDKNASMDDIQKIKKDLENVMRKKTVLLDKKMGVYSKS